MYQQHTKISHKQQLPAIYALLTRYQSKGSPYSITERRVPVLIPVHGSQPAAGCHYFLPGLQLPSQPLRYCLVNRGTMGVNSLPKTVTRQNHGCDLNPGPSVPESSTLTTRLPSHPLSKYHNAVRADTVGEVAAARSGSRPPHDAIRLSAS